MSKVPKKLSASIQNNIDLKVGLSLLALLIIQIALIISFGSFHYNQTANKSEEILIQSLSNTISHSISTVAKSGKYKAAIFAKEFLEKNKNIAFITAFDRENRLFISEKKDSIPDEWYFLEQKRLTELKSKSITSVNNTQLTNGKDIKVISFPFNTGYYTKSGLIRVGLFMSPIESLMQASTFIVLAVSIVITLIMYSIIFLFARRLAKPVRRLSSMFRTLLKIAPISILIKGKNNEIIEYSNEFKQLFLKNDKHLNQFLELISTTSKNSDSEFQKIEESIPTEFGNKYFSIINFNSKSPTSPADDINYTIAINIDKLKDTEKELLNKTEELKKTSDAKTNFLATMSHEMRTPLTSLIGYLSLLKETVLNPKQQQYLNISTNASNNLLNLINDILDYSKIESGELQLEYLPFSLEEVIEEIVSSFAYKMHEKNLRFEVSMDEKVDNYCFGDSTRLRQVLTNLISNSIKFTEDGSIKLKISFIRGDVTYQRIRFIIEDSGIGMTEEQMQNIFDRFTQADASISRRYGGTGLGLSICKRLVELMSGIIWCDSKLDEGTTFVFEVPLALATQQELDLSEFNRSFESDISDDFNNLKVLIADDDLKNCELVGIYLSELNIEYDVATNGEEAVEAYLNSDYHLILMDIQMPKIDGVDATKYIRAYEFQENKPKTRILAFTANVYKEQIQEYYKAGFDGHLLKPFKKFNLVKVLAETKLESEQNLNNSKHHFTQNLNI